MEKADCQTDTNRRIHSAPPMLSKYRPAVTPKQATWHDLSCQTLIVRCLLQGVELLPKRSMLRWLCEPAFPYVLLTNLLSTPRVGSVEYSRFVRSALEIGERRVGKGCVSTCRFRWL